MISDVPCYYKDVMSIFFMLKKMLLGLPIFVIGMYFYLLFEGRLANWPLGLPILYKLF